MINRLGRHFEKHNARGPCDFCRRTAIEVMPLSFAVVIVPDMFVQPSSTTFIPINRARWHTLSMWSP